MRRKALHYMQLPQPPQGRTTSPAVDATTAVPGLVLDTNAVLDWLWFADSAMQGVAAAVAAGRCRWWVTDATNAELEHVLDHRLPPRAGADRAAVRQGLRRWGHAAPPPALPSAMRLPCRDPDDQVFVDLAIATRATWLVTRDRALLELARRAAAHGVAIVPPRAWRPGAP
jgi:hypothetical protein